MKDKLTIAVYCSAAAGLPEHWQEGARVAGRWIGQHGATLVYGGVDAGLMTVVARTARDNGARVVGVVPTRRREWSSPYNDIVVPTSDLNERKGTMQLLADAFVVLPGGYGTLDEFSTSFSYINFNEQPWLSSTPLWPTNGTAIAAAMWPTNSRACAGASPHGPTRSRK